MTTALSVSNPKFLVYAGLEVANSYLVFGDSGNVGPEFTIDGPIDD